MTADKVFRSLHAGPDILILPNAWDAGSARVIEEAGAKAIATSSAAVAWGHGYPDGQFVPFERVIATIEDIARAVSVPVTADIESAYADSAAEIDERLARVLGAGAVGVNIEDGVDMPDLLCAKIERAKKVAARAGVDLWINARVDIYLRKLLAGEAAFEESARRAGLYTAAGADSIFVPGMVDVALIGRIVPLLKLPFNVLSMPGVPDAATLKSLGVRRLSAGGHLGRAAYDRTYVLAKAFLAEGRMETLVTPPTTVPSLNDLMRRP
jgi:2-methylisocitrate lyase-like PEP mutase family enzyme